MRCAPCRYALRELVTPSDHKLTKDEQRQNAGRFGFDNWHPPHHFADPKRARSMARDIGNRLDDGRGIPAHEVWPLLGQVFALADALERARRLQKTHREQIRQMQEKLRVRNMEKNRE